MDFKLTMILEERGRESWLTLHQCLLMLLDSPLNHASYLRIYIKLESGRMIEVHHEARIPRTFKRFEQLFLNLVEGCDLPIVQTSEGPRRLMQFVNYKPKAEKVRIANCTSKLRKGDYFTKSINDKDDLAFVIDLSPVDFNFLGNGRDTEYPIKTVPPTTSEDTYSISRYPLSQPNICVKLTSAFEKELSIM